MPPRVLMIAADYPPQLGGVATYTHALARTLSASGVELSVLTCVPDRNREVECFSITRASMFCNFKYLKIFPLMILTLGSCLRRRPNLLLLMKCNHEGIVGTVVNWLTGIPYVAVAYGSEVLEYGGRRWCDQFMKRFYGNSERVLVDSTFTAHLVAGLGIPLDKIVVVHPGLDCVPERSMNLADVAALKDRLDLNGKRVLLTVARIVKRKGHDKVAEALAWLKDIYTDVVWVIAGDGPDTAYVQSLIQALDLQDRVRMIGRRPAAEIDLLYHVADVFVMPSRQEGTDVEGFGLAFVEAALRRVPVVAGRHGGVPEAVGGGGILVDSLNSREVAHGIRTLLDDPALARRLGEAGHDRAVREFGRDAQAMKLRALFAELVEPRRSRVAEVNP